jgi:hypothetical protein
MGTKLGVKETSAAHDVLTPLFLHDQAQPMRSAGVVRARHFVAAGGAGAELGSEQSRTLLHNGVPSPQQPKQPSTSHICWYPPND